MPQPIIEIENVSMRFNMAKEKVDSFKEMMIRRMKGTLRFEEFFALKNVSLTVEKGDVYGLVGLNGSGKSTLLKIIAGVMKPTSGRCAVHGNVAPLIELGAGFDPDLTGKENIYLNGTVLGMNPKFIDEHYDDIVEFSELHDFMNVAVKNYSSGMVARLAFSVATIMKPDVLICDEILSVGDFLFQKKCEVRMGELMSGGTTVLLVSHDIDQIERMCNKAAWLSKGRVVAQGDCEGVCNEYKENAQSDLEELLGDAPPADAQEAPKILVAAPAAPAGEEDAATPAGEALDAADCEALDTAAAEAGREAEAAQRAVDETEALAETRQPEAAPAAPPLSTPEVLEAIAETVEAIESMAARQAPFSPPAAPEERPE